MRDRESIERTAEGIADTLASIDADQLDATPVERAFLAGSLHALRGVLEVSDADR